MNTRASDRGAKGLPCEAGEQMWQWFKGKREGTLWYYRALADKLHAENNWITKELQRVVSEFEQLVRSSEAGGGAGEEAV